MGEKSIKIRWIETGDLMIKTELLATAIMGQPVELSATKAKALGRLGIHVREGEEPLDAYIRAMCEENGVPYTIPAPTEISDAITYSEASRFVWWLA